MNIDSSVVFGVISIVGSLLIASAGYGAMKQKVANMKESIDEYKKTHAEEHEKCDTMNHEKFKELYESRNLTSLAVERLTVLLEQMSKGLGEINGKVDRILSRGDK